MKTIKAMLIIAAVGASSLAMAEGGSDRIFDRAHAANKAAMQVYKGVHEQSHISKDERVNKE